MSGDEYSLNESVRKIGRLAPILKAKDGEVLDGEHRRREDPDWEKEFSVTLEHIDTPAKKLIARISANVCRRKVPAEEKTLLLGALAKETGWSSKQIADEVGMSPSWVLKYLPEEFKDPEARAHGLQTTASQRVAQTTLQPPTPTEMVSQVLCEACGLGALFPEQVVVEGKELTLCGFCKEKHESGTLALPAKFTSRTDEEEQSIGAPPVPLDSWDHRVTEMKVGVSKMKVEIAKRLTALGIGFESQREFILQTTRPDFYFPLQNIPVYLDGEGEDRDDEIRGLWEKRYNGRVLSIPYSGDSEKEKERVLALIKSELGLEVDE